MKSDKEKRTLGGEIHQETVRKRTIAYSVLGVIAFIVLNLVMYYLTKM